MTIALTNVRCPECDGSGVVIEEVMKLMAQDYARFREPHFEDREVECETCRGNGEIEEEDIGT